jgi:Spy/CpxP family protein refolding chaperone
MLLVTVSLATAQQRQRRTVEEQAKAQTERLDKLLTLTADQKAKIEAINLDLAKQMNAKMQSNQGNREGIRAAIQELNKARDEKYKKALTAEQFKKYSDNRAQRQKETERRRAQRN